MTKRELEIKYKEVQQELNKAKKEITALHKEGEVAYKQRSETDRTYESLQDQISAAEDNILARDVVIENLTHDLEKLSDKRKFIARLAEERNTQLVKVAREYGNLNWFQRLFLSKEFKKALTTNK